MKPKKRLIDLLQRFNNGTATQEELRELDRLLLDSEATDVLEDLWDKIPEDARFVEEGKSEAMLTAIIERNRQTERIRKQKRNRRAALTVAAVTILVTGALFFIPFNTVKQNTAPLAKQNNTTAPVTPGSDKAVLVLDDGSSVTLDNAANGTLTQQGTASILKANGQVIYASKDTLSETAPVLYNTLKTPRGGQYQLVLADGTRVWMNASSSLRFPTAFPGKERIVELTGEAYFEVAKDATRNFSVQVNGISVNVLGTHFNIMAYENESATAITLLEGAVNVASEKENLLLHPGQQVLSKQGAALKLVNNVDVNETIAWKNGYFQFNRTDLAVLMRQIERWYNVDVVYQGKIPSKQFGGKISRQSDIQHVIKLLEASKVYSRMEGNKLTILDK